MFPQNSFTIEEKNISQKLGLFIYGLINDDYNKFDTFQK